MFLAKSLERTTLELKYEEMLRNCNHLQGDALLEYKAQMAEAGRVLNRVRAEYEELLRDEAKSDFAKIFINNPLP